MNGTDLSIYLPTYLPTCPFPSKQTSSGKTYTMEGASPTDMEARGIIPRAVSLLFESIANADPALEFTLKVSIVEICA